MKRYCAALTLLSLLLLSSLSSAQATPATARAQAINNELRSLLEPVGVFVDTSSMAPKTRRARQFHFQWQKLTSPKGAPAAYRLSVIGHADAGTLPKQRSLDLAPGTLLVVALDASYKLQSWQTIIDPRYLRSEAPGPDGVLTGTTIANPSPDFRVFQPNDPEVVELRLYEPHQTAEGKLSLGLVESVRLP